jgi:hypothetical protein
MFNSPLLDVTIGLVFIFLMYSLLTTSINEAIATLFGLRSRMLKDAIITGMLSDTSKDGRWKSIWKGICSFFLEVFRLIFKPKPKAGNLKIGQKFFDHPLIKNYGSSRIYPLPSYIPTKNFSTVLTDVLKEEFRDHLDQIAQSKIEKGNTAKKDDIKKDLQRSRDEVQIMELLNYYDEYYEHLKEEFKYYLEKIVDYKISKTKKKNNNETDPKHDEKKKKKRRSRITKKLENSSYTVKLKELFNFYESLVSKAEEDSVRLKRLFDFYNYKGGKINLPGIDAETLQILQMHLINSLYNIEKFVEKIEGWYDDTMVRVGGWYKRQTQIVLFFLGLTLAITLNVDVIEIAGRLSTDKAARDKIVQLSIQAVDKYKDDPRVRKPVSNNNVENDAIIMQNTTIFKEYSRKIDSVKKMMKNQIDSTNEILAIGWGDYGGYKTTCCKINYVICKTFGSPRKILGFLLLAFAVSLGSPFWFDLLNKLVKLRGAGKKENEDGNSASSKPATAQAPVNVTVNTKPAGEEAVG